jgi:hypothetical protein
MRSSSKLHPIRAVAVAALALAAAGCGSATHHSASGDEVVAVVAGTPIHRSQLQRALDHARVAAERAQRRFPDADSPAFRRTRHAILQQLVVNVEISKAARELHIAVPTAAVYELAQEQGEEQNNGESEAPPSAENAAYARSTVRARLLYEAVAREVTAGARVRPREVERYYRDHRAELERVATSPARARLYAETILLRRRQAAMMLRWVSALERRFRSRVHYRKPY